MSRTALVAHLTAILVSTASAQAPFPVANLHHIEVGYSRQAINRTIRYTDGARQAATWTRDALYLRLTLTNGVAVEVDGFAAHRGPTNKFPNRDYVDVSFGGGATVTPVRRRRSSVGLSLHYHELISLDQSITRYSKRSRQLSVSGMLVHEVRLGWAAAQIWAGPSIRVDWLLQYPPFMTLQRGHSVNDAGALMGGSLLLRSRVRIFGETVYAQHWQSEWGLSLIL